MLGELTGIRWDFICYSETRCPNKDVTLVGGHRLVTSLGDFVHAGVGILIHARWTSDVTTFCRVSDRLLYVDVKLHGKGYRILAIYVPHAGYNVNEYEICLDDLRKCVLEGQRQGRKCMVGGDFNTELQRGWRGDRLRELLLEVHLENSTA